MMTCHVITLLPKKEGRKDEENHLSFIIGCMCWYNITSSKDRFCFLTQTAIDSTHLHATNSSCPRATHFPLCRAQAQWHPTSERTSPLAGCPQSELPHTPHCHPPT